MTVNVSLATLDRRLARRLELRSPVPGARIRGLARLTAAGVYAGLLMARHRFLPVLAREFPALAERYARHYARREGVSPAYQRALAARLRALQERHGFPLDGGMKRRREREEQERGAAAEAAQPLLL